MKQDELKTFIEVVTGYFKDATGTPAETGLPFIKDKEPAVMDYTALIGISGERRGGIYVSASRALIQELCAALIGTEDADEEIMADMTGELANTIAGNVRAGFGSGFMISVPMIISGAPRDITFKLKPPVFVIPFTWKGHAACLAVGVE